MTDNWNTTNRSLNIKQLRKEPPATLEVNYLGSCDDSLAKFNERNSVFLRIWVTFKKKLPLRGLQKKIQKRIEKPLRGFRLQKKITNLQKKLPVSNDFAGNSHKSMVFGAVRRPRKILRPFSAVFRCFALILCFKTRQNIILRTTFKK